MTIEDSIKATMARMIERKLSYGRETVEVDSWNEEFEQAYFLGCETCGYGSDNDKYTVEVFYGYAGNNRVYVFDGNFSELIKELDRQ